MRASSLVGFAAPWALLLSAPALQAQRFGNPEVLAPDFPTPQVVIEKMLQLAHLKPGEMVYDLGSGEGHIVITAARESLAFIGGRPKSASMVRIMFTVV